MLLEQVVVLDDVVDIVYYGELVEKVVGVVEGEFVNLIEIFVEWIVVVVLQDVCVQNVIVIVYKLYVLIDWNFVDVVVIVYCSCGFEWFEDIIV